MTMGGISIQTGKTTRRREQTSRQQRPLGPKPLLGSVVDANGLVEFGIAETDTTSSDGTMQANLAVSFVTPAAAAVAGPGVPLVSLAATIGTGGTLAAGGVLYYASPAWTRRRRGGLSFVVTAVVASDGSSVTLTGLSFTPARVRSMFTEGRHPPSCCGSLRARQLGRASQIPARSAIDCAAGSEFRPCQFLLAHGTSARDDG